MLKDFLGNKLAVGQKVVTTYRTPDGYNGTLEIKKITGIEAGKVYLNNSSRAIKFLDRLIVVK